MPSRKHRIHRPMRKVNTSRRARIPASKPKIRLGEVHQHRLQQNSRQPSHVIQIQSPNHGRHPLRRRGRVPHSRAVSKPIGLALAKTAPLLSSQKRPRHNPNGRRRIPIHLRVPRQRPKARPHTPNRQMLSNANPGYAHGFRRQPVRPSRHRQNRIR